MYHKFLGFVIIMLVSSSIIANNNGLGAIGVTVAKVQLSELYDVFNVVGQYKNDNSRDYYANIVGKVEDVSYKQGTMVNKGDVLLVIDRDIAESTKSKAEALLVTKQDEYERKKALFAKKFVSYEENKRAESDFEDAKSNYSKAVKNYNDMIITAPFAGKIGVIKPKIGDDIKQGDYLFSIMGTENIGTITVELPEFLNGKVVEGTKALIEGKAGEPVEGRVSIISDYLTNNGTIDAKIMLLNTEDNKEIISSVMHNSYVDIALIINLHKNLAIPENCIQRNNQGNFVYKIEDNIVKQLYVETGSRTNGLIEIISNDINEGDLIVAEGMTKIKDGTFVKVL